MNSISIIGRMTTAPELRTTQSGIPVCSFDLAVRRPRVKDTTDYIKCVVWRQSAEYIGKYGKKGSIVGVSGSLTSRKYEDKEGNKRTAFEVVADSVELCESRSNDEGGNVVSFNAEASQKSNFSASADIDIDCAEDLPF